MKMKKIINGRRYDTQTAKLVGYTSYSTPGSLDYWSEDLYRKKTGEYFLYGQGGPMSKYSRRTGENEWSFGHEIRPLTLDEAKAWAEKHLDADIFEAIFGKVEEGKVQVSTWLEESIKTEIDKLRETKGFTIADIIKAGVLHSK
jgi:hypothetical protein